MTLAPVASTPAPKPGANPRPRKKTDWLSALALQCIFMAAFGMLLYSTAADWNSKAGHNSELSGYVKAVDATSAKDLAIARERAIDYNAQMPQGPLRDPFAQEANPVGEAEALAAYEEMLRVTPSETIGEIDYPAVRVNLPIYHGTSETVLRKGVGHLYGSSLPVGGPTTHSVLTSHSGMLHARLFEPILKSKIGDQFSVEVLGEKHWYQVRNILTVEPDDTSALRIIPQEDWVSLITCTPIGINSHRLIVQAQRVDAPEYSDIELDGDGHEAAFPWWIVWFAAGSTVSAVAIYRTKWVVSLFKKHSPL